MNQIMLKTFKYFIIISLSLGLVSCQQNNKEMYTISFFDYMYTYIGINLYVTEDEYQKHYDYIEDIYATYHALTTSYDALDTSSEFMTNVYDINRRIGEKIQIDVELYDVFQAAQTYAELTDNHFQMTLGQPVRIWKNMIAKTPNEFVVGNAIFIHTYENEQVESRGEIISVSETSVDIRIGEETKPYVIDALVYELEVSKADFDEASEAIEALSKNVPRVILEEENNKYYITVEGEEVQLDLGALSKGYATNIVRNYLVNEQVEYFSISAGSSSIALGKNINRPDQDEIFIVSLTDPTFSPSIINRYYGIIHVKDNTIATSGNFEQYTLYEGERYHHIISPETFYPANHFAALTIIGQDAGLLDALSTALFAMNPDTLDTFMAVHQENLQIEVIAYMQDGTIKSYLDNTFFEATSS